MMAKSISKTPSSKKLAGGNSIQTAAATQSNEVEEAAPDKKGLATSKVKIILRYHLKNLSTSNEQITDETVFKNALSDLDIAGMSSQTLFKAISRRDIVRNGGNDKIWPDPWTNETIASLAPKISD